MFAPIIENNINQIKDICQKHHVRELYVFGSASKNEMKEDSDVDFLYTMQDNVPEMEYADNFFDMLWAFEALFNKKVDMVAEAYLKNKYFIREVNEKKVLIYNG